MEIFTKKETFRDSREFLERQQNIDLALVLAKILELPIDRSLAVKAEAKLTTIIDKI